VIRHDDENATVPQPVAGEAIAPLGAAASRKCGGGPRRLALAPGHLAAQTLKLTPPTEEAFPVPLRYLHTMVRVADIEKSLDFYCKKLGMEEVRRTESEAGRYTLVFLAAPADKGRASAERAPLLELTFNWDPENYGEGRNFGHLAFEVDDIYATCDRLMKSGVTINRPPRDGRMAFVRSPDNISIELLQKGESLPKQEPWASMANTGKW
jgi:lactoylglutathione lyase